MMPRTMPSDESARVGLCLTCRHSTTIVSSRDSRFYLCERSRTDPRFPRYPPLPVVSCVGWEPRSASTEHDSRDPDEPTGA